MIIEHASGDTTLRYHLLDSRAPGAPGVFRISGGRADIDYAPLSHAPQEVRIAILLLAGGHPSELGPDVVYDAVKVAEVTAAMRADHASALAKGLADEHIFAATCRAWGCRVEYVIDFHEVDSPVCGSRSPITGCEGAEGRAGVAPGAAVLACPSCDGRLVTFVPPESGVAQ